MEAEATVIRAGKDGDPVARAIARAQGNLLRLQHPDGYWCGELVADSSLCADYVIYRHWAGEVDPVIDRQCAAHIAGRQGADGGWSIYPGGPSEINVSVKSYFALKLAGWPTADRRLREARATILRLGGIPQMNTYGKFQLALLGQYPWEALPAIPPELVLLPRWVPINLHSFSAWTRTIIVPMAVIRHFRPTRAIPAERQVHELYPSGSAGGRLRPRVGRRFWSWRNVFLALGAVGAMCESPFLLGLRARALRAAETWMRARAGEGSDGLGAVFPAMLNYLIALKTIGYRPDHPALRKAEADFAGLFVETPDDFRIQPCLSPVWDTAVNIIALIESGFDPGDPVVVRAARWLARREVRTPGDWAARIPGLEPSGWAFEFNNRYFPDTDDTAMVLLALRLLDYAGDGVADHGAQFPRALRWLAGFQGREGGWAAFDRGVDRRCFEHVPFADHNAILDPPCSDLTGRILELFGQIGYPPDGPLAKGAVAFLRQTQEDDGSWYGRWGVNYLYGTWQVLRGLRAIGSDMGAPWIVRARDWLASCQNEDGGWGETCASYDDPTCKGRGPSTASQTAWAVMGLCACGEIGREAVRRGIDYLVGTQRADGSWEDVAVTGTGFPRVFYLRYDMYRNNWPLLALATYANYRAGRGDPPSRFCWRGG